MDEELLKSKLESFKLNFSNTKIFEQNLEKLFSYIFSNIFQNILNLPRIDFINSLITTVKAVLEEQYTKEIYSNQRFLTLFVNLNKKFEKKYNEYNQLLSLSYENYQNELFNPDDLKEDVMKLSKYNLTTFRKHCRKTQEYAIHNCNKKEKGKYLVVIDKNNKNEIKFVICENCRKSYYAGLFINYCQSCKCDYYCGLMSPKEDKKMFPATYNPPHCEAIANDKINCTKCKSIFYYNINDNTLQCMNKSCKYKISPHLANFKCNVCLSYFKSDVKIFNNFELLYIKRIIGIALLIKEKAYPGILPCCKNLELKHLFFYHKKECKGALYFWILNKKLIVICEKCKAINYFNRFIWTCPNCLLHFKAKKEEIEEKLKKNLFNNLKLNLNLKILLGDEYIPNISFENCNSTSKLNVQANPGCKIFHKMRRKRSLREVLDMKKLEALKNKEEDKDKDKEAEKDTKIGKYILKKRIYESYNDNNKSNSKMKFENSEIKSSLKKKRNYLFEKLIRKQFLPKKNASAIDNNNSKGKFESFSEQKNNSNKEEEIENQNGIIITEKKLLKYREKSEYNFNFLKRDESCNYINTDKNSNFSSQKIDNNKHDKLNNSDDNDQIDKASIIIEYNQKIKKRNKIKSSLPPLPIKIPRSDRIHNNFNRCIDRKNIITERESEREININEDLNLDSKEKREFIYSDKKESHNLIDICELDEKETKIENNEKNTINFNFVYKLSNQNGYHTPKMTMKNDLDKSFRKKYNKKNPNYNRKCGTTISKEILNLKFNLNLENLKEEKGENLVQKLEDKFNETYTQKKTKNITNSQEEEDKNDEKEKEEEKHDEEENTKKEEFMNKKKKNVKNNVIYYFKKISSKKRKNSLKSKFNVYDKINPINNEQDNSKGKEEIEKEKEKEQDDDLPILNINEEKQKYNIEKELNDPYQPDDIISSPAYGLKGDIPIENPKIRNDEHLYNSIQRKMKCILSKGKLPLFNIDNYAIEKQIGEGSFGLIFRVVNKKTNIKYAMKKIIANNLTALESYQREFEIVHQNSHECILDILGICLRCLDQTTYVLYVLMDLALYDWDYEIEQRKKYRKFYKEEELITILKQISSALVFLQREKKIAHRDIKPENILVFKNGLYKIGDFGEAKVNRYMRNNARSTIRGTEMYMSPILFKSLQENLDDVQHNIYKSDVFSLGYCFVYAAALDFKIIYEIRNINSDFKVKKILQRMFFLKYSNDFIELLLKMICNKEEDRVDFIGLEKLLQKEHFK